MSETQAKTLRVMVVDDQDGVRMVVADTVRYAGHDVVATAADGKQAVELAREHRPDIVVMDVQMPQMNGVAAMEAILQEGTATRVVLMSGEWRSAGFTATELTKRGAAAFMEKPFNVSRLFELLDEFARS